MVVGGSRQKTLDPGFVLLGKRQQGEPVILKELVLDPVSAKFTVRDVTTDLSGPQLTSCMTDINNNKKQANKQTNNSEYSLNNNCVVKLNYHTEPSIALLY
ncbi:unnamed protein product [Schistosoma margrebowiei]|uniref:Uncharacterized protein n=1 Tax=Schistosoma margrebowiei TaxID=48269 RepID=A0A183LIQ8_9TREM|nr:unnamed protein product [Schistosoma margrebowiei]